MSHWKPDDLPIVAEAYLMLGDGREANRLLAEAVDGQTATNKQLLLIDGLRVRAMLTSDEGQWEEAERTLNTARALTRSISHVYATGRVLYTYRVLKSAAPEKACIHLQEVLELFRRLGARPYIQKTERALAELAGN